MLERFIMEAISGFMNIQKGLGQLRRGGWRNKDDLQGGSTPQGSFLGGRGRILNSA